MSQGFTLHATSVVFCGHGILLRGASGSGKSDLALRLLDAGGGLISDDYTILTKRDAVLYASAPETIQGLMEVRGIGLLKLPYIREARLNLVIDCESYERIARMPEVIHVDIEGVSLRLLSFYPFESSAVAKIRAFLQNPLA